MTFPAFQSRFAEPAYVTMVDEGLEVFRFEDDPELRDDDGFEIGPCGEFRLHVAWDDGKLVIQDIELKRWHRHGGSTFHLLSHRQNPLSREICAALRRRYGQEELRRKWEDASEQARTEDYE